MDKMPWQAVFFQSFPESIAMICLGLVLVGLKPRWYRVVLAAAVYTVASYIIRGMPIPYGVHTLLMLPALLLVVALVAGAGWKGGTMAAIIGLFCLLILESFMTPLVLSLSGMSYEQALHNPWARVLIPLPQTVVLAASAFTCWKFSWCVLEAGELDAEREDFGP